MLLIKLLSNIQPLKSKTADGISKNPKRVKNDTFFNFRLFRPVGVILSADHLSRPCRGDKNMGGAKR